MRPQFRRTLAAAVCLIVVPISGALAGPPRHDLGACHKRSADQIELRKDDWVKIKAPKVGAGEGERTITSFAAPAGIGELVYVTNGSVVKATTDGGCTWSTIFPFIDPRAPVEVEPRATITHLAASPGKSLWAAGYQTYGGVTRPRVWRAGDATVAVPEFEAVDLGMPTVGRPVELLVPVNQDLNTAYVVVEEPADAKTAEVTAPVRRLYTTQRIEDPPQAGALGASWSQVALPSDLGGTLDGVATSSLSRDVWVWSGSKYAVTGDIVAEEVRWKTYDAGGEIVAIDINGAATATLLVREEQSTTGKIAGSDGKIISERMLPVAATSIAHGRVGVYAISGPRGTFGYDTRQNKWANITPKGAPAVPPFSRVVIAPSRSSKVVLGQTADALYRFDLYLGETFLPPVPIKGGVGGFRYVLPKSNLTDVVLTPGDMTVTLKPGVPKSQPVVLQVPPAANKIDVYFLVDTTNSMTKPIVKLREGIKQIASTVRKQVGAGACFGLGEFKDDTANEVGKVYRRHLQIKCENDELPELTKGIAKLVESSGGDDPEAQTIALEQAITGSGRTTPFVDRNQRAEFRQGAFKVIVLMTDSMFHEGGKYPTIDEAVQALNKEDVKVVSVQVSTNVDPDAAREDLNALAVGTQTFAPEGGVDCDGDGKLNNYDLAPGDPLVCHMDGTEIDVTSAIVGLLLGVQDPGVIAVQVDDPHNVVADPIRGSTSAIVNMKRDSAFTFTLPLLCSKEQDGLDLPIGLLPTVRSQTVLDKDKRDVLFSQLTVRCRGDVVVEVPEPPVKPEPPEVPVDPPARPRPPLAVAIQPPPQPPAQPISNLNMNAGFSQQEEQQFQIATVTQGAEENEEQEQVELAMTGLDPHRNDLVAGAAVLAGATLMSAAAAAAYRRRLQRTTRPASAG